MSETALKAVSELAQEIEGLLNDGDWRRASELEIERRKALEAALCVVLDPGRRQKLFEAAQHETRKLIGQIDHHQRRLVQDAYVLKQSRAAAAAYGQAQDEAYRESADSIKTNQH